MSTGGDDGMTLNEPKATYPPEPKVVAATASAGSLAFFGTLIATLAQNQDTAVLISGLPEKVEPFVVAAILAVGTFVAGWLAKHQHRRGVNAVPPSSVG